jgi:hypothetical protein
MEIGKRDLTAGDIVAGSFRAWFGHFGQIFIISLLFTVPIFIVNAFVLTGLPEIPEDVDELEIGDFLFRSLVGTTISLALGFLLTAALAYAFLKTFRGELATPSDAIVSVFARFGAVLVFALIAGVLTAIGFLILILPGLVAIVVFSLGIPAILNERISGTAAVSRCWALISGNWAVAIGVVVIGFLINFAVTLVVGGIVSPGAVRNPTFDDFDIARTLVQIVASALVAPLIPGLATALYLQLKGRQDGFPSVAPDPDPYQPYE